MYHFLLEMRQNKIRVVAFQLGHLAYGPVFQRSIFFDIWRSVGIFTRVSIVPGLFQFSSPGTFGLVKSRDFLVPGPSGSLGPVLSGPGT